MAQTSFTTSDALTQKLWSESLFRDMVKESYFSRFMSGGSSGLVHVKNDFEKKQGDRMTFGIRMRLTGAGVTEGQTLEGNEEALSTYSFNLTLSERAHAVRDRGPMDRQRAVFNISEESESALRDWGSEKIDADCFTALAAAPSKIFYGGTASSTATVAAGDLLTPALISKAATWAKTGGSRNHVPLRPVRVEGGDYYVLLVHPDQEHDLRNDTTWTQAQREANVRGKDNPLFQGSIGVWGTAGGGVIVHSHENIPITTNWGSGANVNGAKAVLLGAQSLCFGWGQRPQVVQETFDYGRQIGYGLKMIFGVAKPVFNSKDYGSVAIYTSRTAIS